MSYISRHNVDLYFEAEPLHLNFISSSALFHLSFFSISHITLKIDGATVKTDEKSLEMCLRSKSGVTVVVKSDNHANKAVWVNAFEAQIEVLAFRIASAARPITAEEKALTISYAGEKEEGDGAGVRNVVIPSVAVKEAETFANSGISSPGGDNHHLTSPFNNYKSPSPAVGFHIDTDITPSKIDPVARSSKSPGSAGRNPLVSFVSSAKLMTDGDDADGDDDSADLAPMSPTYKGDPSLTLVEFITEDDDASTDEGKPDDDFAEGDNDELLDGSKRTLSRKNGSQSSNVDSESGVISALESLDSPDGKGKATSPGKIFRPKSVNFGCQPEKIVSHADFDVAPELLTTAQKVAILESAAYQYRTNQLSIQPREPRKSFIAAPAPTVSANGAIDGYTPTGLRLENPVKVEGHTENDGGAVAKTQDTVVNKISKWEGWSKEKSASPLPPSRTLGK